MTELGVTEDLVEALAVRLQPTASNHRADCPTFVEYRPLAECVCDVKVFAYDRARAVLAAVVPEVRRQVAEEWLAEMAIEQSDPRLNYTTVQISHAAWDEMNAAREIGGVDQ